MENVSWFKSRARFVLEQSVFRIGIPMWCCHLEAIWFWKLNCWFSSVLRAHIFHTLVGRDKQNFDVECESCCRQLAILNNLTNDIWTRWNWSILRQNYVRNDCCFCYKLIIFAQDACDVCRRGEIPYALVIATNRRFRPPFEAIIFKLGPDLLIGHLLNIVWTNFVISSIN